MWYVYYFELANGGNYVGSTNDLRRRFGDNAVTRYVFPPASRNSLLGSFYGCRRS